MFRSFMKSWPSASKLLAHNPKTLLPNGCSNLSKIIKMSSSLADNIDPDKLKVIHDTENSEFYIQLADNKDSKAVLQYSYLNPSYVDLEHTIVPPEFRGHGVAKKLAQAAFDHFVKQGAYMRPTCTYLQKFYKENPLPEYKDRVKWK